MASERSFSTLKIDTDSNGIQVITMSRPKNKNAFTDIMAIDLARAFEQASANKSVKVVVLTGDPAGKAFCAGADLGGGADSFKNGNLDSKEKKSAIAAAIVKRPGVDYRDGGGISGLAILNCTKPVICAINGHAVGVGITLACCCDVRVASEDASISFAFVRRGLCCETISSWTLPKIVGLGKAQELVLTGKVFKAKDEPGLFNYVTSSEMVMKKALELAQEISIDCNPDSVCYSRHLLLRCANASPEDAHLLESKALYNLIYEQTNVGEGVQAFLEKRKPKFTSDAYLSLPNWFPWWNRLSIPKL